jgi:DNA-binding MarR family transcriptional regulator
MQEYPVAPPPIDVITAAASCSRQLVRRIDRDLAGQGLTWSQFRALVEIHERRGWVHAASIARRVGVSRQAASALFAKLDERGFLRWWDEGWIKSVQLTKEGVDALGRARHAVADTLAAVGRLSVEERRAFKSAELSIRRELSRPPSRRSPYWEHLPKEWRDQEHPVLGW